jgi:hypothetical protein
MPKRSNKRKTKRRGTKRRDTKRRDTKTIKQKPILMIGCSKKNKKSCKKTVFSSLGDKGCPNCGPNCHCGPNCQCIHPCPGTCYLNRRVKKQKGGQGQGCGSCGCPIAPLSTKQMNQFGGEPVIISPPSSGYQPILGSDQNGGNCSTCGQIQSGGTFYKPIGPIPGPFVGKAWAADKLPGENGIGGDRNYLKSYGSVITNDPQQQMSMNDAGYNTMNSMVGGYTYGKKSRVSDSVNSKRGGGLVPQDLVNLGRDFSYNFKSAYNALNGYNAPVDPSPYKGQLTGTLNNNQFLTV